jgi:pectinesterase
MKEIFLLLMLFAEVVSAQEVSIPRDTSFTVYSAFTKERKKYPFIEIAQPSMPKGVLWKKDVVYASVNNRQLHADVFYPAKKSTHGYPGVVLIFGGGWRSGNKSQSIPMAQQIASKGYVTVAVEYRLSLEAPYPAAVHDIRAAIRWLRANAIRYNLDKSKIAVHGVSAGGQLAALVGTTNNMKQFEGTLGNLNQSSAVQAIIDVDGVLAFKHPESVEGKVAAEWLGGTYEEKPDVWTQASALTHVNKTTPPILFINSSLPRFHAGRDDMTALLNGFKIYNEVHTLPDTPHPFWLFHPWFDTTVKLTIDFLDKVFKKGIKPQ